MKRSSKAAQPAKKRSRASSKSGPRKRRSTGRGKVIAVVAIALLLAFVGYRFFRGMGMSKPTSRAEESEAPVDHAPPSMGRVVGRWTRTDSPARIEIKSVAENGHLEASYLNPHSIRIQTAAAKQESDYIRVYLKLDDPSDPGSTYRLNYDPNSDV